MEVYVLYGRSFLSVDDEFYEVELYDPDKDLKLNTGYIRNNRVYVYHGEMPVDVFNAETGVYSDPKTGKHKFIASDDKKENKKYSLKNVTNNDPTLIFDEFVTNKDQFVNEEDIAFINNNSNIFRVQEHDSDDFLKRAVKRAINSKQISLKSYGSKSETKHEIPNLKSTVLKTGPMTMNRFQEWADLLNLKWTFIVTDGGDDRAPLKEDIILESEDFQ